MTSTNSNPHCPRCGGPTAMQGTFTSDDCPPGMEPDYVYGCPRDGALVFNYRQKRTSGSTQGTPR